jgi:hypothetical protein
MFGRNAEGASTMKGLSGILFLVVILSILALLALRASTETHKAKGAQAPTSALPLQIADQQRAAPVITLDSPYTPKARMYRGQLHAHTTNSDGTQPPAQVMAAYKKAGYGFVAITDHNWITVDPGVPGILHIQSVENNLESGDEWKRCHHENRIGAKTFAPGDRKPQEVIDRSRSEDGFVQINHPDWPGSYPKHPCWSDEDILAVSGYDAVEAWNASDDDSNNNAEPRIDYLLSHGRKTFLTAVDDCHDVRAAYCMTSSVNVFADVLTREEIMANLKAGNFYASSGALVTSVAVSGSRITVMLPKSCDVEYVIKDGTVAAAEKAVIESHYDANGSERYVRPRIRCTDKKMAWVNPIYVTVR